MSRVRPYQEVKYSHRLQNTNSNMGTILYMIFYFFFFVQENALCLAGLSKLDCFVIKRLGQVCVVGGSLFYFVF